MTKRKVPFRGPDIEKIEEFAREAPNQTERQVTGGARIYPWEETGVRSDVNKGFSLRLPEPYWLKLKYIGENTPDSMQTFIHKVLLPAIDEKIRELTEGQG